MVTLDYYVGKFFKAVDPHTVIPVSYTHLVNTYAHIQQSSRMELGKKFENSFYAKPEASAQTPPVQGNTALSMAALLELLKDADPETKAQLRLALLT